MFLLTQTKRIGVDLALKVFHAEQVGEEEGVSSDWDVIFLNWNESNSFLLKYSQLSISQSRS